jgi:hypothetical protein
MSVKSAPIPPVVPGSLNPAALSIDDTARLLTRVGGERISVEMIEEDVADGAPANPDGSINLVNYCAWLIREVARGD